jgi:hypothetical protein
MQNWKTAQHWWRMETFCSVKQAGDGVCIAPYMLPFLMLVDIFLLSFKKKRSHWKTLDNSVFLCTPDFEVPPAGMFIDRNKFCPCRKQAFCLQRCPLWLVYTIVFTQQNLLSLWQQKLGEFFEFLYSVKATHFAIFFWNVHQIFGIKRLKKTNKRKKDSGVPVHSC